MAFSNKDIHDEFQKETFGTGDGSMTFETVYKALNQGIDVLGYLERPVVVEDGFIKGPEGVCLEGSGSWEDDYSEESCP